MNRSIPLAVLLLLTACAEGTGPGATRLHGVVRLQDAWGRAVSAGDYSGVTVSVANGGASTQTMIDGTWELTGLPAGPHDLEFTAAGFAPVRVLRAGAEPHLVEVDTAYLAHPVTHVAVIDSVFVTEQFGPEMLIFDGHITAVPPDDAVARPVIIFEDTSATVSGTPGKYVYHHINLGVPLVDGSTGEVTPPTPQFRTAVLLEDLQHRHGSRAVHFAAYASSAACSCYIQPATGARAYTNLGPAGVVHTFVIP